MHLNPLDPKGYIYVTPEKKKQQQQQQRYLAIHEQWPND